MNRIKKIFYRDFKAIIHNPIALLIVLGVAILPSLYAWVNIVASWDPYSNTSTIPVAIVNHDLGATINDKEINVGESVIEELKENDKIAWKFVDDEEADLGLENGTYYASIILDENFSMDLTSLLSDNPVKPTIIYKVNTKENPVLNKITTSAQETLTEQIKTNFLMTVNETAFGSLNEVGDKLKENEHEILLLKKDIYALNSNIDFIISSLNSAEDTALNINVFLTSMQSSLPAINDSIDTIKTNNATEREIDEETKQSLLTSMEAFENSMDQLSLNIDQIKELSETANDNVSDSSTVINEATSTQLKFAISNSISEIDSMINYLTLLKENPVVDEENIDNQISNLNNLKTNLNSQYENVDTLTTANQEAIDMASNSIVEAANQADKISYNLNATIDTYNEQMESDIINLYDTKKTISYQNDEMLTETQNSINSLYEILGVSISGSQLNADLSNTLVADLIYFKESISLLNDFLNKLDDDEIKTIISVLQTEPEIMADNLTNPFEIEDQVIYPLDNYGSGMTPIYSSLAMWVGAVILTSIFSSELKDFEEFKDYTVKEKFLGKFILFGVTAIMQGLILMLGNWLMLGVQVSNLFVFLILGTYCSFIFSLIVYTNVSLFGDFGKALNVILLVLQIAGTGGAYPIQLDPPFFKAISPFLPFTYSLGISREGINGVLVTSVLYDVLILSLIGLIFLLVGYNYKEKIYYKTLKFNEKFEESHIGE